MSDIVDLSQVEWHDPAEGRWLHKVIPSSADRLTGLRGGFLPDGQIIIVWTVAPGPEGYTLGELGVLADTACGRSVLNGNAPEVGCRTVNLRMDAAGSLAEAVGPVHALGTLLSADDLTALAAARVLDSRGRLLAHAVGQFAVVRNPPHQERPAHGTADVPPADTLDVHDHLRDVRIEGDGIRLTVTPEYHHANEFGGMHGGLTMAFADAITRALVDARLPDITYDVLDLTVRYHRPLPVIEEGLTAHGRIVRAGRRIVVTESFVEDSAGRIVAGIQSDVRVHQR